MGTESRIGDWDSMGACFCEGKSSKLEIIRNKSSSGSSPTNCVNRTVSLNPAEPLFLQCKMGGVAVLFTYDYGNQMII